MNRLVLQAAADARLGIAALEWLLDRHRATLHRHARRARVQLRPRQTRTPDRAGWLMLASEHGLDHRVLARVTGLRADYVRAQLERHGLVGVA